MEHYDFNKIESKWYKFWEDNGFFKGDENSPKPPYSIVIPPPNVTGSLHMGHALNNTLQDALCRYKRLKGFNVLWVPGTDHAGIATQNVVERNLANDKISRHDLGRDKFIDKIWEWREKYGHTIINQLKRLGASCDWERERFTMDEGLSKAVREVFVNLYEQGLIYKGDYIINWCPRCHTALSDLEVEMDEGSNGYLWYIKYPIKDQTSSLVVATTRPETILGDTAVAVNPSDERYKDLVGKSVILPIINREIPIIADDYVEKDFGTGVVKITPAHDFNDFMVAQRHNLPSINVMTNDAVMNENADKFEGLDRFECRKKIIEDLKHLGMIDKIEDYKLVVGHCYRCKSIVEPRLSKQWFVKIKPLAEKAIDAVKKGETRIIPEQWENNYFGWMENIRDWCISRQIWWGHRIPAWLCSDCGKYSVSKSDIKKCLHCNSSNISQEDDVLDTWFSSALWPFSTMGWPNRTKELEVYYPTSVLVTGFDILFFWVARMMMMGLCFMKDVPFRHVYIHALVRDENGEKMSKSKGNVIDPLVVIDKFGADSLRLTLSAFAAQGRDIKLSESRVAGYKNFINKIWNATKFILINTQDYKDTEVATDNLSIIDKWILHSLKETITNYEASLEEYRFNDAVSTIYQFAWYEFCDWFIEASKINLSNDNSKYPTQKTLINVFKQILQMLHPFTPFVTEELWQNFDKSSIMLSTLPSASDLDDYPEEFKKMEKIKHLISGIRNIRGELNISPSRFLNLYFYCEDQETNSLIQENSSYINKLANLKFIKFKDGELTIKTIKDIVDKIEVFIDIEGAIDISEETKRLSKEIDKTRDELAKLENKLRNDDFIAKAKPDIVEKSKEKYNELSLKLEKAEQSLSRIKNLN